MENTELKVGDYVQKKKGYKFLGVVVSVLRNTKEDIRVVAEHLDSSTDESSGMLHIFNPSQLEPIELKAKLIKVDLTEYRVCEKQSTWDELVYVKK